MIPEKLDHTKGKLHRHDESLHIYCENPLNHTCIANINKEGLSKEDVEKVGDEIVKRCNAYPVAITEKVIHNAATSIRQLAKQVDDQQVEIKELHKFLGVKADLIVTLQTEVKELKEILVDNPIQSDVDAAQFTLNLLRTQLADQQALIEELVKGLECAECDGTVMRRTEEMVAMVLAKYRNAALAAAKEKK